MWQKVYEELGPQGLDIVTVALDTDPEAARPFAVDANPTHPSLLDPALLTVERFGFTNVPFGIWIDEAGTLVRPAGDRTQIARASSRAFRRKPAG